MDKGISAMFTDNSNCVLRGVTLSNIALNTRMWAATDNLIGWVAVAGCTVMGAADWMDVSKQLKSDVLLHVFKSVQ